MTFNTINTLDVSSEYYSYLNPIHDVDTQDGWPKKAEDE
jgi:hypothetical protein